MWLSEFSDLGVRVGLEIHQQLATGKKLFCGCRPAETEEYSVKFQRRLRAAKGELGEYDPAALFEKSKSKSITYYANPQSSCLVEQDEEPPHDLDGDAKKTALVIASALKSRIFDEIYPMRKTVVDGSNTTGFQRTMLVSQGGSFEAGGKRIGIQSVCLEEDAAKNLGDRGAVREFGLGRLGIPLVEIATEPFETEPQNIRDIALALGRILRSTKKVRRGLGSIRQDVNVSIRDGGTVIEVKGVQQLDQLEKVAEYEAKRQDGLLHISKEIRARGWKDAGRADVTELFSGCESKIVQNAIRNGDRIFAISFGNMHGMFGYSPHEGIRLGKEIAELVRAFGIGGLFHSDELPDYGIGQEDVDRLTEHIKAGERDAFLVLACPRERADTIMDQLVRRMEQIRDSGIPADTRLATQDGQTRFLRPRPGAARMYPETDIAPVTVSEDEIAEAEKDIPKSWDESIAELQKRHGLNPQLAEQIFDSRYADLFEEAAKYASPAFVASVLCSTITNLERGGLDSELLQRGEILRTFELLKDGRIAKESVEIIFGEIMGGRADTVEGAMSAASIETVDESELEKMIRDILGDNEQLIRNQKERAIGPLMGIAMKRLRGKASGETVNGLLTKGIRKRL